MPPGRHRATGGARPGRAGCVVHEGRGPPEHLGVDLRTDARRAATSPGGTAASVSPAANRCVATRSGGPPRSSSFAGGRLMDLGAPVRRQQHHQEGLDVWVGEAEATVHHRHDHPARRARGRGSSPHVRGRHRTRPGTPAGRNKAHLHRTRASASRTSAGVVSNASGGGRRRRCPERQPSEVRAEGDCRDGPRAAARAGVGAPVGRCGGRAPASRRRPARDRRA